MRPQDATGLLGGCVCLSAETGLFSLPVRDGVHFESAVAMSKLGKPQRTFAGAADNTELFLALFLLVLGVGGVLDWFRPFGLNPQFASPVALVCFLLCIGGGGLLLWIQAEARLNSVRLYQHGLALRSLGRQTAVAWDEVQAVTGAIPVRYNGAPAHVGGAMRLDLRDGRRVTVPGSVKDFPVLADRVHAEASARLLPGATQRLREGARLDFGPLSVDRAGLHLDERTLLWADFGGVSFPWRDYGSLTLGPNRLCLHADDPATPWAAVPIQAVPNANLLLALSRERSGGAGGESASRGPLKLTLPPDPARAAPDRDAAPDHRAASRRVTLSQREAPHNTVSQHDWSWGSLTGTADNSVMMMGLGGLGLLIFCPALVGGWAEGDMNRASLAVLLLGAAGIFVAGLVTGLGRPRQVDVSPAGLGWTRFGRRHEQRWNEVEHLFYDDTTFFSGPNSGVAQRRLTELRVVFEDGTKVRFGHFLSEYDRLVAGVQAAVTAALTPAARRQMSSGGAVFGPIRLMADGIATGRKTLPWDQVERVWVGNGQLGLRSTQGHSKELALKEVPNYGVLLTLLRERLGSVCELPALPRV